MKNNDKNLVDKDFKEFNSLSKYKKIDALRELKGDELIRYMLQQNNEMLKKTEIIKNIVIVFASLIALGILAQIILILI